jgi:hypothetical protein
MAGLPANFQLTLYPRALEDRTGAARGLAVHSLLVICQERPLRLSARRRLPSEDQFPLVCAGARRA